MRILLSAALATAWLFQTASYPVGFSVLGINAGVGSAGTRAFVWRPIRSNAEPMPLAEFARLACPSRPALDACLPDLAQPTGLPGAAILSAAQIDALAREPLRASHGGEPAPGSFPLAVLYGTIASRGGELISLAEALASRGVVAAAVVPPMAAARPAFSVAETVAALERVEHTIRLLAGLDGVDGSRIALAAWSFGGVPAGLAAMSNKNVKALVSLDSALRYQYGADLIKRSGAYQPAAVRGRVLSLVAGVDNAVAKDDSVLRDMVNARVDTVTVDGMRHGDFSDLYTLLPYRVVASNEAAAFRRTHGEMLTRVISFIRDALR